MKKVLIVNGPNLNLLGQRQPQIYGSRTMDSVLTALDDTAAAAGARIEYRQSNHEGELIDIIQQAGFDTDNYKGIVLNAGAYTHTSLALADAIAAVPLPVVEVHISNVAARHEAIRHKSLIAPVCKGTIAGFGTDSYRLGLMAILAL